MSPLISEIEPIGDELSVRIEDLLQVAMTDRMMLGRDYRIDFVRGIALLIIYTDHVTQNPLARYTPARFGFSDMAEVFVFSSGYVCGLSYLRKLESAGFRECFKKALIRALQLYCVNCVMSTIAAMFVWASDGRLDRFLAPSIRILTLQRALDSCGYGTLLFCSAQGTSFLVLPLYIVLIGSIPLMLIVWKVHPLMLLVPSFLLYMNVQLIPGALALPGSMAEQFYFNPLAWQLLFVIGVHIGATRNQQPHLRQLPNNNTAILLLVAMVAWSAWQFRFGRAANWPYQQKEILGPLRLAHFSCLLVVASAFVPSSEYLARMFVLRPVLACGQCPLLIYCLSGILAMVAGLYEVDQPPSLCHAALVNLGGWSACCLIAMTWRSAQQRQFRRWVPPNSIAHRGAADVDTISGNSLRKLD